MILVIIRRAMSWVGLNKFLQDSARKLGKILVRIHHAMSWVGLDKILTGNLASFLQDVVLLLGSCYFLFDLGTSCESCQDLAKYFQ